MDIDKAHVALRFAQAGLSYSEHAVVQKQIALHLAGLMAKHLPSHEFSEVLEIGCGSGNLTDQLLEQFRIKKLLLNDLYAEVQQHFSALSNSSTQIDWLIGDIEQVALPKALNLVASCSALQWLTDFNALTSKVHNSLSEDGYFCFSSFGPQNLIEIKTLTGQGLNYFSAAQIVDILVGNQFEILHLSEQRYHLDFTHPKQVLQHLKATGVTATASGYRWTKHSLQKFYQDYQQFSEKDEAGHLQYALTYHPIYCIARRKP